MNYCKSRPLTNKKANIKTHKYGVAILMYDPEFAKAYEEIQPEMNVMHKFGNQLG